LCCTRPPAPVFVHELVRVYKAYVGHKQRRKIDFRHEQRVEINVYNRLGFLVQDWIEFREDGPDTRDVIDAAGIGFKSREQIVCGHEPQFETVAGLLLVDGEDLERTAIVGGDEQVVAVSVREVTIETCKVLLDHCTHCVVGGVVPRVERDVNQRLGGHGDSVTWDLQ
jgi:hypothetical protein